MTIYALSQLVIYLIILFTLGYFLSGYLLTNAINYTSDNATITIQATLTNQHNTQNLPNHEAVQNNKTVQSYQITVTDNGQGLPVGMEVHIFERFTRGDSESNTTGLGLGLALSRDLVQHLGGTLSASNIQPHGAQFVIGLPWQPLENLDIFDDKFTSNTTQIGESIDTNIDANITTNTATSSESL